MQPISNPYPGINAHLNSHFQNVVGWSDFHATHIGDLKKALKAAVMPLGYTVDVEQSLQIRTSLDIVHETRSDAVIFDTRPAYPSGSALRQTGPVEKVLPISNILELDPEDEFFPALVISRRNDSTPVAIVELLSPSNKPPRDHFEAYHAKRKDALRSGLVLVEIDYLHQQPPTMNLPDYTRSHPDSHPYRIAVFVPRPDIYEGNVHLYEFDVDAPIPAVRIPLGGDDVLTFDFGAPYHKTFEEALYGADVDYSQPPTAFETYLPADRERILQRMRFIADQTAQ